MSRVGVERSKHRTLSRASSFLENPEKKSLYIFLLFVLFCEETEKLADTRERARIFTSLGSVSKQRRKIVFHDESHDDALNGAGFHARLENGQSPPPPIPPLTSGLSSVSSAPRYREGRPRKPGGDTEARCSSGAVVAGGGIRKNNFDKTR